MFEWLQMTEIQWMWLLLAGVFVGIAKTGLSAIGLLNIPIMAVVFGGRGSTGILLPMLLIGDLFGVWYYNRHAEWRTIRSTLPWALLGIVVGSLVGSYINDAQFKMLIALSIFICLFLLIFLERKGEGFVIGNSPLISGGIGITSGFTSMIGNAAGPIYTLYLLSKGMRKNDFIGTMAWFFFIMNLMKVPFQVFAWHNITWHSTAVSLTAVPAIAIGALFGIFIVKRMNEKVFQWIVRMMTFAAAVRLLF